MIQLLMKLGFAILIYIIQYNTKTCMNFSKYGNLIKELVIKSFKKVALEIDDLLKWVFERWIWWIVCRFIRCYLNDICNIDYQYYNINSWLIMYNSKPEKWWLRFR